MSAFLPRAFLWGCGVEVDIKKAKMWIGDLPNSRMGMEMRHYRASVIFGA